MFGPCTSWEDAGHRVRAVAAVSTGTLQPTLPPRPPRFQPLREVDSRSFEMLCLSFPFPRGSTSEQCRAADGVRGGQRCCNHRGGPGGQDTSLLFAANLMVLGPQVCTAPAAKAAAPASLSGTLVLRDAGMGATLVQEFCMSQGCSQGGACNALHIHRQLYTSQPFMSTISSGLDSPTSQEGKILLSMFNSG